MKKFLSLCLLLTIFMTGLFAEQNTLEEHIENFIKNGSYIKYVYIDNELKTVKYWLKSDLTEISISDEKEIKIYDKSTGKFFCFILSWYTVSYENNNIIITMNLTE